MVDLVIIAEIMVEVMVGMGMETAMEVVKGMEIARDILAIQMGAVMKMDGVMGELVAGPMVRR